MGDEKGIGSMMVHGEDRLQSHSGEKPRQAGRILVVCKEEQELELCKG